MNNRRYREVFFAYNGPGPYLCFYCEEDVTFEEVAVHHEDEDKRNNDPNNLKAGHDDCHMAHHMKTRVKQSAESLALRSASMKKLWADPEFRAKRMKSMQGVKRGDGGVKGRRRVRQRAKIKEMQ
jgi:hypothetical protein